MLRKWTTREKLVKYQNFPTHFGLLLFSLECSGEISRKSVESAHPINSLKVDVFLLKSYATFSLVKVPNQLAPRLEVNRKPMEIQHKNCLQSSLPLGTRGLRNTAHR